MILFVEILNTSFITGFALALVLFLIIQYLFTKNIKQKRKGQNTICDDSNETQALELLREKEQELLNQNEELNKNYSHIQKINQDLIQAKNKAEESDRLKSAFLANMSHEVRTPMNGILGFTELFCRPGIDDQKRKMYSNIISNSANQLLSIINDILDLSLIEAGQAQYQIGKVSLNKLLDELTTKYLEKIQTKNLEFSIINQISEPNFFFEGDYSKLSQILDHLLRNAIKFTNNGFIKIVAKKEASQLVFAVSDSGTGVRPEHTELIFDRFRQAEQSITKRLGGTGLGLTISKAYVEMADGKIWVESDGINGSTFFFSIPFQPSEIEKDTEISHIKNSSINWERYTLLLAEDETDVVTMICEVLEDTKIKILKAKNGKIAVDITLQHPEINLVLMDIKMPVMNGIDATIEIKKIRNSLPVIAQTAYTMSNEHEQLINSGCNDILTKPLDRQALIETIAKYLL